MEQCGVRTELRSNTGGRFTKTGRTANDNLARLAKIAAAQVILT
jgi:hypothetical protein